jgi:hypothetical protein
MKDNTTTPIDPIAQTITATPQSNRHRHASKLAVTFGQPRFSIGSSRMHAVETSGFGSMAKKPAMTLTEHEGPRELNELSIRAKLSSNPHNIYN